MPKVSQNLAGNNINMNGGSWVGDLLSSTSNKNKKYEEVYNAGKEFEEQLNKTKELYVKFINIFDSVKIDVERAESAKNEVDKCSVISAPPQKNGFGFFNLFGSSNTTTPVVAPIVPTLGNEEKEEEIVTNQDLTNKVNELTTSNELYKNVSNEKTEENKGMLGIFGEPEKASSSQVNEIIPTQSTTEEEPVSMPEAAMPEAAIPEAAMPEAAIPEAAMPEAAMPAAMPEATNLAAEDLAAPAPPNFENSFPESEQSFIREDEDEDAETAALNNDLKKSVQGGRKYKRRRTYRYRYSNKKRRTRNNGHK